MRNHRNKTATFQEAVQDQIYIVESILDRKVENSKVLWKIKWLGFPMEQPTWEPTKNIQPWIVEYYEENKDRFSNLSQNQQSSTRKFMVVKHIIFFLGVMVVVLISPEIDGLARVSSVLHLKMVNLCHRWMRTCPVLPRRQRTGETGVTLL